MKEEIMVISSVWSKNVSENTKTKWSLPPGRSANSRPPEHWTGLV